jgi:hypothetical protein
VTFSLTRVLTRVLTHVLPCVLACVRSVRVLGERRGRVG